MSSLAEPVADDEADRTGSALERELSFTIEIAKEAGRLLVDRYERVERVDYKSARDVVTEVDGLSEAIIIEAIRDAWPGDGILAEESGQHHAVGLTGDADSSPRGRTWVIDPLDGTVNYANGLPFFCVSIGLVVEGIPVVGVVHDPIRGEMFLAASDTEARLNDRPIAVSDKERLSDFVVSLSLSGRSVAVRLRAIRKQIRVPRTMGSAALALAYVANGRFDAFVQQGGLSAWDVAAAGLIAERAGATVTDMTGGPWFDLDVKARALGIIAAPRAHHGALVELAR